MAPDPKLRGLSLVEVTVSFTLLALMIAFVVALLPSALAANARANQEQEARGLAEDSLEAARQRAFSALVCPSTESIPSPSGLERYHIQLQVFAPKDEDPADVKGLRAQVDWEDKSRHLNLFVDQYVTRIPR